jgi:uncharacterized DUF497 family protein
LKILDLIWLDEIVDKLIQKHHVEPREVVEILKSKPHFRYIEKGHRKGENVYAAMGQTRNGRYLIVFFVLKKEGQALVISAREMTNAERKRYEEK